MGARSSPGPRPGARRERDGRSSGARARPALWWLFLFVASALYGCGGRGCRHVDPVAGLNEDAYDVVTSARIDSTYTTPYPSWQLGSNAYRFRAPRAVKPAVGPSWPGSPPSKVHPLLERWLADSSATLRKRLIVTFRDTLMIPRLPPGSAMVTAGGKTPAGIAIDDILTRRKLAFRSDTAGFAALEADVIETFWLHPAAVVELPLPRVRTLELRNDIVTIEPVVGLSAPPGSTVGAIRTAMSTNPYYNVPPSGDKIALLDTGVLFSHEKLSGTTIGIRGDCVDGGATCTGAGADPGDVCLKSGGGNDQGHGTCSAALISGLRTGRSWQGLTQIPLDSYRVYGYDAVRCARIDRPAVLRAFDVAVANGARVLVAEIQDTSSFFGSLAKAADKANHTGGAVVVAATGNTPGDGSVCAPASARRVLGIGAHIGGTTDLLQSRGPTPDGRIKPDIQAPTEVITASSALNNTSTTEFGGTSCATALAGASAGLLREWLMAYKQSIDPGQVYAQMILSGTRKSPFTASTGAGPLRLPAGGRAWWGKVSVSHHEEFKVKIPAVEGWVDRIDVAIWWPEDLELDANGLPIDERNDIDLYLYDPNGTERGRCETQGTVFERTSVYVPATRRGMWTVEIFGYETHGGQQTVYWSAVARPSVLGDEPPVPDEPLPGDP